MRDRPSHKKLEDLTAEQKLRLLKSQEIIDTFTEAIITTDLENKIVYWNPAAEELLGYTSEEILGHAITSLCNENDTPKLQSLFSRLVEGETIRNEELHCLDKFGKKKVVLASLTALHDSKGEIKELVGFYKEVTTQKKTEADLIESESLYRSLYEFATDSMLLVGIPNGEIVQANTAFCDLLEYNKEEISELNGFDIIAPDLIEHTQKEWQNQVESKGFFHLETKWLTKSKKQIDVSVSGSSISLSGVHYFQLIGRDITEQKIAKQRLIYNEQQLKAIFDNSLNAIVVADDSGRYTHVNQAACEMFGYEESQMLSMNVADLRSTIPDNAAELFQQYLAKGMEIGEFNFISAQGENRTALYHAVRIRENFNLSILSDITERKQIEEDNIGLSLKMKEAYKLAKLGWWELEAETNSMSWSDNLFEIFGFDSKSSNPDFTEVMEKNVHPEDRPNLYDKIGKALSEGIPYDIKLRIIRSDGTTGYMEARAEPVKDKSGKVIKLIGTSLDISDRIEAQAALEDSEKRFQNMASNLVGAIFQYVMKADGTDAVIYMSPSCYDLWEVEASNVMEDAKILWDMVHLDDVQPMYESVLKSAEQLEPWFFQWRITTPSGKLKWLEATGRPERKENGDVIWDSLIMDVTQKKLADLKFQESEERFEAFMENTPASIFIKDRHLKHVYGNRQLLDLIGKSKEEYVGTTSHDFFEDHTANDLDKADNEVLKSKKKVEIEFPFKSKGQEKWLRDIKFPIVLPNGDTYVGGLAFDITEKKQAELNLKNALDQVTELKNKYEKENIYLKEEIDLAYNYQNLIYVSNEISEVLNQVDMVAGTNATVLLQGETGTGKEIVARAIHNNSLKNSNPLIKVNCAAIPHELIESELFGHKKGAFTGAISNRTGKFELANGGTLFLDEIGELPIEMQPKLLRVLQEGEIEPIGSSKTVKVDVRIIAATNRNLLEEIEKGSFREDLFFRLNVFPIHLPPLRERKDDIPVLINHFVSKFSDQYRKELRLILKEDLEALMNYNWPGNVRELENFIERSVIVSKGDHISFNLGTNEDDTQKRDIKSIGKTLDDVQREHIIRTLNQTDWKISGVNGAAAILDVKPSTLRDRMKKLNISKV